VTGINRWLYSEQDTPRSYIEEYERDHLDGYEDDEVEVFMDALILKHERSHAHGVKEQ